MALLLMVLMLIADGVVADGDIADWVDGSADCDDGNAYLQEFLPLLTWISVCPGEIVHNLLCLNIRDNTACILQHLHFPLLIKIRIDLFSSNPTSRSSLPRATPPQGR